jgi:uncharacterized membrane protein YfcA
MDALVTLANVLNVAGFFMKDRLWARALALLAAACIGAYLTVRPAPFAHAVYWNALFVLLNACFLVHLALERVRSPRARDASEEARRAPGDRSAS